MKWLILAGSLLLASCATSPTGRTQLILLDDKQMNQMGVAAFAEYRREHKTLADAASQRYVRCIADALLRTAPAELRGLQWQVEVFEDDDPNAFALPGGHIGVHSGMLKVASSNDQLAAVIGHEIGHVLARHSAERVSQQFAAQTALTVADGLAKGYTQNSGILMAALGVGAQVGVLLPYSRLHESEADRIGLGLAARAGFDPAAAIQLWRNMERAAGGGGLEFLSTHPSHSSRIEDIRKALPEAEGTYRQALSRGGAPECRR